MEAGENEKKSSGPGQRLRVGLVAADFLRVLGLQALFDKHARVEVVPMDMADVLNDPALRVVLLAESARDRLFYLLTTFRGFRPDLPLIVIGNAADDGLMSLLISVGVKGCLADASSKADIVQAIEAVHEGSDWAMRRPVPSRIVQKIERGQDQHNPAYSRFTSRERQVLALLVEGSSNRTIAHALLIEERTVKSYIGSLMRKVGVRNRIMLSMHALEHNLVLPSAGAKFKL